jgi:signal peptidase I
MKLTTALRIFLLTVCLSACSQKPVVVEGGAMLPSFKNGDKILVDKQFGQPKRGAPATFLFPKDRTKWYFKRVVGLPNETIEIRAGKVYIDGQILDEPYLDESFDQA